MEEKVSSNHIYNTYHTLKEWENKATLAIINLTQFVNKFQIQAKLMLSMQQQFTTNDNLDLLNEKLNHLEGQIEFIEARVFSRGCNLCVC